MDITATGRPPLKLFEDRGQYPRALQAVSDAAAACMVIAPEKSGGDPLSLAHAILCAVWGQDRLDFLDRALAA